MKSNFIPVGKAKKKAYKIIEDHDKILEEFDANKVSETHDLIANRIPVTATQMADIWWQRMGMMRIESQFLHNVVDEVASRQREIEPIDIKDAENLLMFDMEGNEL